MQTARDAFGQHVVPDSPRTVGAVAANEAGAHLRQDGVIITRAPAGRPREPSLKARAGNVQDRAHPGDRPDGSMLGNEREPHSASRAKKAVAFFRMSRSARSRTTS